MSTVKFKHVRNASRRPVATIAVDEEGNFGVTICRENEQFVKKVGREYALANLTNKTAGFFNEVPDVKRDVSICEIPVPLIGESAQVVLPIKTLIEAEVEAFKMKIPIHQVLDAFVSIFLEERLDWNDL